ncbi:MAG: hypothetical protein J2P15_12625, partial [Micromonosporaceae bacterium]|nr:hypothetical protein [Micromonosporaceae bacterium]
MQSRVPAPRVPPLAHSALRRMAHRRTDTAWLAAAWQRAKVLVVEAGTPSSACLLLDGHLLLVDPAAAPDGER